MTVLKQARVGGGTLGKTESVESACVKSEVCLDRGSVVGGVVGGRVEMFAETRVACEC